MNEDSGCTCWKCPKSTLHCLKECPPIHFHFQIYIFFFLHSPLFFPLILADQACRDPLITAQGPCVVWPASTRQAFGAAHERENLISPLKARVILIEPVIESKVLTLRGDPCIHCKAVDTESEGATQCPELLYCLLFMSHAERQECV